MTDLPTTCCKAFFEQLVATQRTKTFLVFFRFITKSTRTGKFEALENVSNKPYVKARRGQPIAKPPNWRINFCRLSATAYSGHSPSSSTSGGLLHPEGDDVIH